MYVIRGVGATQTTIDVVSLKVLGGGGAIEENRILGAVLKQRMQAGLSYDHVFVHHFDA